MNMCHMRSMACRCGLAIALLVASAAYGQTNLMKMEAEIRGLYDRKGRFVRVYWFEKGIENGNPLLTSRLRVNAPEAVIGNYKDRIEVRSNGMIQIKIDEDLAQLAGAELYLELWGGHPGTANKRVTPNGRTTYEIPKVGTEEKNCTYQYPTIPLKITDLVNGYNAIQFACDQGTTFWGHYIVDNACLRCVLKSSHPDLKKAGLNDFKAVVTASPSGEEFKLGLECSDEAVGLIDSVEFQACYSGYAENGSREGFDWHGFTKNREPVATAAQASQPPFAASWDISMIPDQPEMAVRAVVHFKDHPEIVYETATKTGLKTPDRKGTKVTLHSAHDLPRPFWSRANREATCTIDLDVKPAEIERVQLHVVIWDGGKGKVAAPFTLNGHPQPVAGGGKHDVLYRIIDIQPAQLNEGANEIRVLSDTTHHGIEVLLPGPALVVRTKGDAN